jgi:hypothetical protein
MTCYVFFFDELYWRDFMKDYRVKVTEKHSDFVWVKANSREEAKELAQIMAECEFESLYDCEIVEEDSDT